MLILVPVAILFGQSWAGTSERMDTVDRERNGVEYAIALGELTRVMAEAQSAALHQTPSLDPVNGAVAAVDGVDARLGAQLGTTARWTDARVKIQALGGVSGSTSAVYDAYAAVTDLLLALHAEVRDNARLSRDPQGDTFHLQEAGAAELPALIVGTGRLADLAGMAVGAAPADRTALLGRVLATRTLVDDDVAGLTDNLQASLDETESDTLSTKLLTGLNRFRQGVDKLYAVVDLSATESAMAAQVSPARTEAQRAQADLMSIVLTELDTLLRDRGDELGMRRITAVLMLVLAVLIAAVPFIVPAVLRRAAPEPARLEPMPRHAEETPGGDDVWSPRRRRAGATR
ncbi:hypothetical protein J2S43_007219 [Catenuloplanes nepalensis]|uniref:Nitrate/nitrite sensing protein domain-containing protein n=1 Tax=Catenuloplanes nepalensis TaxID=587533 RepID=A0ABT9N4T8_9ACTN|nr:hypothetical protein [Catenuloplanes nepalensis]MDP9798707.1 hypothetical protein [Catenuloplanes nepalensis]